MTRFFGFLICLVSFPVAGALGLTLLSANHKWTTFVDKMISLAWIGIGIAWCVVAFLLFICMFAALFSSYFGEE